MITTEHQEFNAANSSINCNTSMHSREPSKRTTLSDTDAKIRHILQVLLVGGAFALGIGTLPLLIVVNAAVAAAALGTAILLAVIYKLAITHLFPEPYNVNSV